MRTTSAASIATSVPAPIAMPTSALVSAGASLMPSPTIAVLPFSARSFITFSLPSGRTLAITSSTPASAAICLAAASLSPDSIITLIPISFMSATASRLSSLIGSDTASIPRHSPFAAKKTHVFPCSVNAEYLSLRSSGIMQDPLIKSRLPPEMRVSVPAAVPVSPLPATALKSVMSYDCIPFSSAYFTTAFAIGCSLFFSSE